MVLVGGGLDDNNSQIWDTIISLGKINTIVLVEYTHYALTCRPIHICLSLSEIFLCYFSFFLKYAGGGVGKARFGVISTASDDPCCGEDSSWVYYRDLLTRFGLSSCVGSFFFFTLFNSHF